MRVFIIDLDTGSRRSSSSSSVILRNPSMGMSVSSRKSSSSILSGSISRQNSGSMEETSLAISLKEEPAEETDLDPFSLFENHPSSHLSVPSAEKQKKEALAPLEEGRDLPEGFTIASEVWAKLQELRLEKMRHEMEMHEFQKSVLEMEKKHQQLQTACEEAHEKIEELSATKEALKEARVYDRNNAHVVIKISQGQDEVDALSSNQEEEEKTTLSSNSAGYEESILVARESVESVNGRIRALGGEKIATMDKMKDFRKNINLMQWESKFMEEQKHDLEEHYTDLHMLRVTRTLQNQIRGRPVHGDSRGSNAAHDISRRTESTLVQMQKAHKTKLAKLEKALAKAAAKVDKIRAENASLEQKKEELQVNVRIRERVKGNMGFEAEEKEPAGSGMSAAKARLRNVAMRRKLNDVIRAQKDEIDFLMQQRQKLHERSFPSFANTSRAIQNPDYCAR